MYIDNSILIPAEKKDAQKRVINHMNIFSGKRTLFRTYSKSTVTIDHLAPTCFFGSLVLGVIEDYTTILMIMIIMFAIYKLCSLRQLKRVENHTHKHTKLEIMSQTYNKICPLYLEVIIDYHPRQEGQGPVVQSSISLTSSLRGQLC